LYRNNFINSLATESNIKTYLHKVEAEWNQFIEGGRVNTDIVPRDIYTSWHRSKSAGVNPYSFNYKVYLENTRAKELTNYHKIIKSYGKLLCILEKIVNNNEKEFEFRIVDNNCKSVYKETRFIPSVQNKNYIGIDCSEELLGTSSVSLAIRRNYPVVILQKQHFCRFIVSNSVAAPIHNEKNEVIGAIGIAYNDIRKITQVFYLVKYLTKLFDLVCSSIIDPLDRKEEIINQIIEYLPMGIFFTSQKNGIELYNNKLLEILNINTKENIDQQLKKLIPELGIGTAFVKKEVNLDTGEKKVIAKATSKVLSDKSGNNVSNLLFLEQNNEIKHEDSKQCYDYYTFDQIVGNNVNLREAKDIARNVAKTSVPVLIFGESGTGKEMFAQAIHQDSSRRHHPFVAINCGALPAEIIESELFGYEEGAFTGALRGGKTGKIEAVSGGTLFLDEIESMPLHVQIKILRVLSTGRVLKVGSNKEIPVDLRVISATKKDLLKEADNNLFREDLYYRISTFVIKIPALRERQDDIRLLAQNFISKFILKYGLSNITIEDTFFEALTWYHWRGNVRELENIIERAILSLGSECVLNVQQLPDKLYKSFLYNSTKDLVQNAIEQSENKQGLLALVEEAAIEHALRISGGNITTAAAKLGINRRTIHNKLLEYPELRAKICNKSF